MSPYLLPVIGGALIGAGSVLAMAAAGKTPGVSGVVAKVIRPKKGDAAWRVVFLLGIVVGAGLLWFVRPDWREFSVPGGRSMAVLAAAGFLVGFGARMGGGCTSGHGVCGIGSGARDALFYTVIFMSSGALTVWIWNLLH